MTGKKRRPVNFVLLGQQSDASPSSCLMASIGRISDIMRVHLCPGVSSKTKL